MIFFENWWSLLRILVSAALVYTTLILMLRISGKRTLSDMNIFDFVITVALGTTFSSTIISPDVTILNGLFALALLILLQFSIAWITVRFNPLQHLIKSQPQTLFSNGTYHLATMKHERVSKEEILQAMRKAGISIEEQVEAVILETNGNFSIVEKAPSAGTSTLRSLY